MELSEHKLSLLERLTLKYYESQKTFKKVHTFGKTKISLLLIPHSNDTIVKIEISHYLLGFLLFIASSLFILGLSFLDELVSETEDLSKVTWEKSLKESRISEEFGHLKESSEKLATLEDTELSSNMKIYIYTVEKFAGIYASLSKLKANFQSSMDYLETRESIFESMPRGRPLGPGVGLITSTFGHREDPFYVDVGEFHNGIDFASASGTPIYATAPGVVAEAFVSDGGLGMHVRINHENGFFTMYGHCSKLFVAEGDIVKRGDIIAHVGATGKATGSHLHYEVHIGLDAPINPQEFINID